MKSSLTLIFLAVLVATSCQQLQAQKKMPLSFTETIPKQYSKDGLYGSEKILEITLTGNLRKLFNDRTDNAKYHPLTLSYINKDSINTTLNIKVKTRGHFRRSKINCATPPLWINFRSDNATQNSIFVNQDKLKLVTACRRDKYVIREYLVYRLYNLISPKSFKARLVRVVYNDNIKGKKSKPQYGIFLENEKQMAKRNNAQLIKQNGIKPEKTDREMFLKMAVFQYLIANTDWSVQYQHNIKLLKTNLPHLITVPYDFDHAGIVSTPYAKPAEALKLTSVRERRYRGYCIQNIREFDTIIDLFNKLKDPIYNEYSGCNLLEKEYIKFITKFLDKFYETINNRPKMSKEFKYPCNKSGTGNVVIKGLGEN